MKEDNRIELVVSLYLELQYHRRRADEAVKRIEEILPLIGLQGGFRLVPMPLPAPAEPKKDSDSPPASK